MSNKILSQSEKVQALQYLFDLARSANAPAAVHTQAATYAQALANSFSEVPAAPAPATSVAEAIAQAQSRVGKVLAQEARDVEDERAEATPEVSS